MADNPQPNPTVWPQCPTCHVTWVLRRAFSFGTESGYRWVWMADCTIKKCRKTTPVLVNADGPVDMAVEA